jgi:ketosteroid isomerase-like protein
LFCLTSAVQAQDARAGVDAGNLAFKNALLKGDAVAIGNLYTADAKVIAPGGDIVVGRPAIAAFWKQIIDTGVKHITLTTTGVESAGDLAFEEGTVKMTGTAGQESVARYIVVWKRDGGAWKLHRDIWNQK